MKKTKGGGSNKGFLCLTFPSTSVLRYSSTCGFIYQGKHGSSARKQALYSSMALEVDISSSSSVPTIRREKGYWGSLIHQRNFLDQLAPQLGVKKPSDWYDVSRKQFEESGGRGLLKRYVSLGSLLKTVYPEVEWIETRFSTSKPINWKNKDNQRAFLDRVALSLGIRQPSDWYKVTRRQILEKGGQSLYLYYPTLADALRTVYPGTDWDSSKFNVVDNDDHNAEQQLAKFLKAIEHAEKVLEITKPEDWYSVNLSDLKTLGFPTITRMRLAQLLKTKYPDHEWRNVYLLKGRFAQQRRLERAVKALFPNEELIVNARREAGLISPETGEFLELDVYIKSLNLAFEFQERHHYTSTELDYQPLEKYANRDKLKRKLAAANGITILTVPFWWDGTEGSLLASLRALRPDLLEDKKSYETEPIPEDIPAEQIKRHVTTISDIGAPVTATFFTLSTVDPTRWWVFEKYDGVRGFWNPLKKAFYSRKGNQFTLPQEVIDDMPEDLFLDGELWFGEDNFQEALKISNRADPSIVDWAKFKYMVFDIPNHTGSYQERYTALTSAMKNRLSKFIEVAPKKECEGLTHLEKVFQDIIDKGGEGIILRDPNAPLQPGRSAGYLKHKKFRDAEGRVVSKKGPYQWECELPNGIRFIAPAGTTEFTKRHDPKEGDIVSFKHHGFMATSKKPKFPTLYRLRNDLTWEDVVNNWKEQKASPTVTPLTRVGTKNKPKGYWSRPENRRDFLLEFAKERSFDPYKPENWDNVSRSDLYEKEGGASLLARTGGNMRKLLGNIFPELKSGLKEPKVQPHHWNNVENCRKFFNDYAQMKGFDPLLPENWYSIALNRALRKRKGGVTIKLHHGGWRKALQAAYPEIDFAEWKQKKTRQSDGKWENPTNCREFFMKVAEKNGIDYTKPKDWYSINQLKQECNKMGGFSLGQKYGGFKKALIAAFPELPFDKWQK